MIPRPRRALSAAIAVASVLAVTGCGISTDPEVIQADRAAADARETQARTQSQAVRERRAALPRRGADEVAVSVSSSGTAAAAAVRALKADRTQVDFSVVTQPTEPGFADLCAGNVDVLQSSRRISPAELAGCKQNGLSVGAPVVLGYATAVLVTENGRDIGGDCLTLAALRSLLARGSTITSWRQIGFGSQGFAATAPPVTNPATAVVAAKAFGRPPAGGVTRNDFRGDLRTTRRYDALTDWVTNQDRLDQLDRETRAFERSLARRGRSADREAIRRAEATAARRVVREIAAENAERARRRQAVRDPEALERQNAARVEAAKRAARRPVVRRIDARIAEGTLRFRRDRVGEVFASGRLGVVPYTFYELHSDVLRPLEIDPRTAASDARPDCRFPSQQTIVNETYPLIQPVYLYGDFRVLRTSAVRVLLDRLLTENAALTRGEDLTGLSSAALVRARRGLGLPPLQEPGATSATRTPPTVTNATPNLQPGDVPGVSSGGAVGP